MGCDIHLYVEKYDEEKKEWTVMDNNHQPVHYNNNKIKKVEETPNDNDESDEGEEDLEELYNLQWFYTDRNYDVFAILADVRNGFGFAGCDTGDGFEIISEPKGLPDDVSSIVKQISEKWDCDGHSHSYLTLTELLEYDWINKVTKKRGYVNEREYPNFKTSNRPSSYCGFVSGGSVRIVSNREMDDLICGKKQKETGASYYTQVEWIVPYKEVAEGFYESLDELKKLVPKGKEDQIRIVFFFDN
ncbi:hypothetical protein ABK040_000990 [Willaertia magna]